MATEKNIAALLREDAKTIRVAFQLTAYETEWAEKQKTSSTKKLYNYVTHLDIAPGDLVLVEAINQVRMVEVVEVDSSVNIDTDVDFELRWVIMKVDLTAYNENAKRNQEIKDLVSNAYRDNLRRSFRGQVLANLEAPVAEGLQKLIGGI